MASGFIQLKRGDTTNSLIKNHSAYILLSVIALRARRNADGVNIHGLAQGEALLGDYENYGMTASKYRHAKKQLAKSKLATFRTTNRGTIAKLVSDCIFCINETDNDNQNNKKTTSRTTLQATPNNKLIINNKEKIHVPENASPELLEVFEEFRAYRKEKKNPLTPMSEKKIWKLLSQYDDKLSIYLIEKAMMHGWKSPFPPNAQELKEYSDQKQKEIQKDKDRRLAEQNRKLLYGE